MEHNGKAAAGVSQCSITPHPNERSPERDDTPGESRNRPDTLTTPAMHMNRADAFHSVMTT